MRIATLAAASILALTQAAGAQDLMLFPPETFGQVIAPRNESMLDVQLEAQVGSYNNEFVSSYGPESIFARTGRAVGMLQILTNVGHAPCTAFLVEGNMLVTNNHCVPGILKNPRMVERGATSIAAVQFHAGFLRDGIAEGVKTFHVNPVPLETSEALDYTVLQVLGDANAEFVALELSAAVPSDRAPFWVIGHPMGEAQRISREKCQADSPAVASHRLRHTCDTLPGNSGSPVIDAGSQKVIGLHHAGSRAGEVNFAVPMAEILAQSKVLTAVLDVKPDARIAALQAELARRAAESDAERAKVEAERKRLVALQAELDLARKERDAARADAAIVAKEKLDQANQNWEADAMKAYLGAIQEQELGRRIMALEAVEVGFSGTKAAALAVESKKAARQAIALMATEKMSDKDPISSAAGLPVSARTSSDSLEKTALVLRGHLHWLESATFSFDGKLILTSSRDGTARVWDFATGKELVRLPRQAYGNSRADFSPNAKRIVIASPDKIARIFTVDKTAPVIALEGHGGPVYSASFSPDGSMVVTASWDKTARIWDSRTGRKIAVLRGHSDVVWSAAFSPDGKQIVTASDDETARIWNVRTGKQLVTLSGHSDEWVKDAKFSPDGTRIVTASTDQTARIWDAETGRQLAVLKHPDGVASAAFSPDGARIVTACYDGVGRIWDVASGREIARLSGHSAWLSSAEFSPDGTMVVTASQDKTARVWGGN